MELVHVVGSTAFMLSFMLVSTPFPALYEGVKKMQILNITLEYLLIGYIQTALWSLFGHKMDDFFLILTNDVCLVLFQIYLNMFFYINRMNDKMIFYNAGLLAGIFVLYQLLNGQICLILASSIGTAWQFSMLRTMKKALEQKDASFINLPIACVSFCCSSMWSTYSILQSNFMLFLPNGVGLIMWSTNLLIFAWTKLFISDDNILIKLLLKAFSAEKVRAEKARSPLLNELKTTANDV